MKKMILALAAVMALSVGTASAQSYSHEAPPMQNSSQHHGWSTGAGD